MSSPFSKRSLYLKRRNQDLIKQLESNSAILEGRLKKLLTRTQPTPGTSANVPGFSATKRKSAYDSWLARNSSGQVSAALNPLYFQDSSSNIISNSDKVNSMPLYVDEATMTSPAKRSKFLDNSCHERQEKESLGCLRSLSSKKKFKVRRRKACRECYCQASKRLSKCKKQNEMVGRSCVGCSYNKSPNSSFDTSDDYSKLNSQRKTLEEARTLINYSPESIFLRRLKKRSQTDLNEPDTSGTENDQSSIADGFRQINNSAKKKLRSSEKITVQRGIAKEKLASSVRDTISGSHPKAKQQFNKCRIASSNENPSQSVQHSVSKNSRNEPDNAPSKPPSRTHRTQPPQNESGSCGETNIPQIKRTMHPMNVATCKVNQSPVKNISKVTSTRLRTTQSHGTNTVLSAIDKNKLPAGRSKHFKLTFTKSPRPKHQRTIQNTSLIQPTLPLYQSKVGGTDTSFSKEKTKEKLKPSSQNIPVNQASSSSKKTLRTVRTISSSKSASSSPSKKNIQPSGKTRAHSSERVYPAKSRPESPVPKSKQAKCKLYAKEPTHKNVHDASVGHGPVCLEKENFGPSLPTSLSPSRLHRSKSHKKCYKPRRKDSIEDVPDRIPHCFYKMKSPTGMSSKSTQYEICPTKSLRSTDLPMRSCCDNCCCYSDKRNNSQMHTQLVEPHIHSPGVCDQTIQSQCQWVDEISKYRQSHWFDCHAYKDGKETSTTCISGKQSPRRRHNGSHRYILNERLFPLPLPCIYQCNTCCPQQQKDKINVPEIFPREITVNSTRNPDGAQPKQKSDSNKAEPFKIYREPRKKSINRKSTGCTLTHPIHSKSAYPKFPVPANSLALRYQKGVI